MTYNESFFLRFRSSLNFILPDQKKEGEHNSVSKWIPGGYEVRSFTLTFFTAIPGSFYILKLQRLQINFKLSFVNCPRHKSYSRSFNNRKETFRGMWKRQPALKCIGVRAKMPLISHRKKVIFFNLLFI